MGKKVKRVLLYKRSSNFIWKWKLYWMWLYYISYCFRVNKGGKVIKMW